MNVFLIQRYPFDTKSLIGYSFGAITQYTYVNNMLIVIKCLAIIGTATLLMLFTILNDINADLSTIDAICAVNKRTGFQMVEKLYKFIQFHSDTIQLSFIYSLLTPNAKKKIEKSTPFPGWPEIFRKS